MHSPHRRFSRQLIWIGLLLAVASPVWGTYRITESSLAFGRFGTVVLYSPPAEPDQVVLFISGDGGWNLGVVDMARELAGLDALVVGIDIRHFLKSVETGQGQCAYPAADFESCSPVFSGRTAPGKVKGGRLVRLPKVGHGFSVPRNWMPQFKDAFAAFAQPLPAAKPRTGSGVDDLPLVNVAARQPGDTLAILLTGDGGWAGLDRALSSALAAHGTTVIGWDSLRYYWTPRTPDGAARDLARILAHYRAALKRQRIVLIGYSFGADVLPFLARRLPPELKAHVEKVVLLGPGTRAHFEFKLTDWLGGTGGGLDVYSEVARLRGMPLLCVRGAKERDSLCPKLDPTLARTVTLPGGHHFGRDYAGLARLIQE